MATRVRFRSGLAHPAGVLIQRLILSLRSSMLLTRLSQLSLLGWWRLLQGEHAGIGVLEPGDQSFILLASPIDFTIGAILDVTDLALLCLTSRLVLFAAFVQ